MEKGTDAAETDPGPSSGELIGAEFRKRRQRLAVYAVGGLIAVAGGIAGFVVYGQHKATTQANAALSSLSMCLFGAAGPGEHASVQFRLAQLGSMGFAGKDRGMVDGVSWPERCAPDAQELLDRAKDAGLASSGSKDVAYWSDQLAKRLKAADAHLADAAEAVDQTFAESKKAGLVIQAAPDTKGPPSVASARVVDDVVATSAITKQPFPLAEIGLERSPGEVQFGLVQDATVTPTAFMCSFEDAGIVCSKLPDNLTRAGHGLKLLGSTEKGASPLIFEGNRGDGGVFRSDSGELVDSLTAYGGSVTTAGGAYVLGWDVTNAQAFVVSRPRGASKPLREPVKVDFDVANNFWGPQVLWNMVVVPALPPKVSEDDVVTDDAAPPTDAPSKKDDKKDDTKKDDKKKNVEPGVYVLPIDEKAGKAADASLVLPMSTVLGGDADREDPHIEACRTDKALAIVARGSGRRDDLLTIRIDGRWTSPLVGDFRGTVTCDGAGVAFTTVERAATSWNSYVHETQCTSADCATADVDMKPMIPGGLELAPRGKLLDAIEVNEKLVVAWAAGERGGVRVRVGASREMANAKDTVVVDDLVADGKPVSESVVSDLRLIHAPGSPGHAVLLLSTKSGVIAFRIDPSGDVTPEKVSWK